MAALTVTVLVDNDHRTKEERESTPPALSCEWGLSLWLSYAGEDGAQHRLLLDAGSKGGFAENASRLGIPLEDAEYLVLSHAHYDHTDGADAFLAKNQTAKICLAKKAMHRRCYSTGQGGAPRYIGIREGLLDACRERLVLTEGITELFPGVTLVPHSGGDPTRIARRQGLWQMTPEGRLLPDHFDHEQSLVVRTDRGLTILSPCSHTGMAAITREVGEAFWGERIHAFVGGLHLFRLDEEETRREADVLKALPVDTIYTGHCTGEAQTKILAEVLGAKLHPFGSGSVFTT